MRLPSTAFALRGQHSASPLPDGSGQQPSMSRVQARICDCAGQAAPHARDPAGTHEARKDCAASAPPINTQQAQLAFRYLKAASPANEDSFAAARAALALLRKARKDTIVFLPHLRRRLGAVRATLDPHVTLEDTIEFNQLLLAQARRSMRSIRCASISPRSRAAAWRWRSGGDQGEPAAPDVPLRTLDALSSGPTTPDHSTVADVRELSQIPSCGKASASIRSFFARQTSRVAGNKTWQRVSFLPTKCRGRMPRRCGP